MNTESDESRPESLAGIAELEREIKANQKGVWLDAPNDNGWWWFLEDDGTMPYPVLVAGNQMVEWTCKDFIYIEDLEHKGTWQKIERWKD